VGRKKELDLNVRINGLEIKIEIIDFAMTERKKDKTQVRKNSEKVACEKIRCEIRTQMLK